MQKITVKRWDDEDALKDREYYSISHSCFHDIAVIRCDKDHVLVNSYFMARVLNTVEKIGLVDPNSFNKAMEANIAAGRDPRVTVVFSISTSTSFLKLRCANPDVGNPYYMGHTKLNRVRYFKHDELQKTSQIRRKRTAK